MTEHDDQADQAEEPARDEAQNGPEDRAEKPRGRGLALLALLIALLAAGAAGWVTWQAGLPGRDDGDGLAELSRRVDQLGSRVDSLQDELAAARESAGRAGREAGSAAETAQAAADRVEALDRSVSDLADEVASLQQELNERDRRLDTLADRLDERGGRSPDLALALAQAEHLVHAAYHALELERDPERAARAMTLAAERLRGLQAPGLTRVREAVAGELEALRGVASVDREALAARLAGLADSVERLPLKSDLGPSAADRSAPREEPGTPRDGRGWWQATRDFMGEYFTVRRTDETGTTLPAPGTLSLMRDVLRLALEQARLAMLRGDSGLYRQSLERADALLDAYFAGDDAAVASARRTLAELRDTDIQPSLPELGGALEALRAVDPDSTGSP